MASGTFLQKTEAIANWTHGLIISYDSFKKTTNRIGQVDLILQAKPQGVILDEAHHIKNPQTAIAKAIFKLIHIPYRIALTGTPALNKTPEVFNILRWLYPQTFTSRWKFLEHFFYITSQTNKQGIPYKQIGSLIPSRQQELLRLLNQISTQRKRKEVMPWLPEKDYQQIKLPPTPEQKKYLQELQKYFETEHVITQNILDRLLRMRQICLHPALLNLKGSSPKITWIKEYLKENPTRPTIIFSKFTSFIKLLQKELLNIPMGVIIGATPIKERNSLKTSFQQGKLNLLLLNIDTSKEALTLDQAETIIFTDKFPPIGDILQAEDRFIATTKTKQNKPHLIIELMMKGTYDEKIYKLIRKRKAQIDIINDYKKYLKEVP